MLCEETLDGHVQVLSPELTKAIAMSPVYLSVAPGASPWTKAMSGMPGVRGQLVKRGQTTGGMCRPP